MSKEWIISAIKNLSDEDYKEVMYAAIDPSRPVEINRAIIKHGQKFGKKAAKRDKEQGIVWKGTSAECNPAENPGKPKPVSSREESVAAFKVSYKKFINFCTSK